MIDFFASADRALGFLTAGFLEVGSMLRALARFDPIPPRICLNEGEEASHVEHFEAGGFGVVSRGSTQSSGNLSNVPLHVADVGTENYDQEFTLSLIENEQFTLDQIHEALGRIDEGTYGRCEECEHPIARPRLQVLPYTRHCIDCARKLEKSE